MEDPELGVFFVRTDTRARRLTFRQKEDGLYVTVPPGTQSEEIRRALEELRPRLLSARERLRRPPINLDFRIDTPFFQLSLTEGKRDRFLSRSELGRMEIICPPGADFADTALQKWLHKVIEEALRRNAKIILPPRLYMLAQRHGLQYKEVKIHGSNSRWGSCSARGSINLSYYLVLLPQHLIDYVLLHELAHTREMNHSPRFWALLDTLTDGRSAALRAELKTHRTGF